MADNTKSCCFCDKTGRSDNIIRHIATHKKDIRTAMTVDSIKHCIANKFPLMFVKGKMIYCLICHKYATSNSGINEFIEVYKYSHKKCIECFESVSQYYTLPSSIPNLFESTEPASNVIVPDVLSAENESLRKQLLELTEKVKVLESIEKPKVEELEEEDERDATIYRLECKFDKAVECLSNLSTILSNIKTPGDIYLLHQESNLVKINQARLLLHEVENDVNESDKD